MNMFKTLILGTVCLAFVSCEKDPIENNALVPLQFKKEEVKGHSKSCDISLKHKLETKEDQMGPFSSNAMVTFGGKVWSVGGYNHGLSSPYETNEVWSSTNGVHWQLVTGDLFEPRTGHTLTVFKDKLWLIGGISSAAGTLSDIWYSDDGLSWNLVTNTAPFGRVGFHSTTVFNDKLHLIKDDKVWVSADGFSWTLISSGAFPERNHHQAVVLYDALYILGGISGTAWTPSNDIWKSFDGIHWSKVISTSSIFSPRYNFTTTIYRDKVYLLGGTMTSGYDSDELWYTTDMEVWCKLPGATPFGRLTSHATLALHDELWIFGGFGELHPSGMNGHIWSIKEF